MQFLIFTLTYPIIWLLSKLPMRILYFFSDVFFMLIYYVFKYRKKVVYNNISLAFPEKSDLEIKSISKKFFKHFCDIFFESIKSFSISKEEIMKRYTYKNPEIINNIAKKGQSITLLGAHQANWEWLNNLPIVANIDCFASYTNLENVYFDKIIKNSREKFGFNTYKKLDTIKGMISNLTNNKKGLYLLLSDQSPQITNKLYWTEFLGIKVPIHTGAEILSKRFNLAVVNYTTNKIKRGYYETEFTLITETPNNFDKYQITDNYLKITELAIRNNPEHYLWSHKRFKHKDKVPKKYQ